MRKTDHVLTGVAGGLIIVAIYAAIRGAFF